MTTDILRVTHALTQPVIPPKAPAVVDLVLTFRVERPGAVHGPAPRLPLNLSVVIDRSGSMAGKPLQQAIAATEVLLDQLGPDDTLSVVAYDNRVDTVVPPQPVTDPAAVRKLVRKIRPGGSTDLHGGWEEGCIHVLTAGTARQVRRVLLLTDGQANVGTTDPKTLIAEARTRAAAGVPTTTLGFGRDFNEDLLIGMAEASGGNFYFIETPDDAAQVFQIEGESLTSVGVRNLAVTLTPAQGVTIRDVLNRLPTTTAGTSVEVSAGDVYSAEDRVIAVELDVAAQARARKGLPLLEMAYTYEPVLERGDAVTIGDPVRGRVSVAVEVGKDAPPANIDVLQHAARVRVARAKEEAVDLSDARKHADAAAALRGVVERLRQHDLAEEYEIAEEVAQLDHFAASLEKGELGADDRKVLRDQAFQGRNRNRSDLNARGGAGGSARSLPTTDTAEGGVEVRCFREGGKLRTSVVTAGYEPDFRVLLPRGIREEGVHYVVDGLELSKNGTFYRPVGAIRRLTNPTKVAPAGDPTADPNDPLKLAELFAHGGEPWLPLLKPVIERQPQAAAFIGPARDASIVPVRELTFQALKPNPPHKWKVVVFGQNPYPRAESATGIAMFDNAFVNWNDSQFGKVITIRCIIKAAAMWKHKIPKATPIADMRKLLAKENTVQPPEWFQAMLTQGVLLLNAALTASGDASLTTDQHTAFWRPVVETLVEEILKAKQADADPAHKGVVFAWWGAHARGLRGLVERLQRKYPDVTVRHIDHCNPAAQGDIFCDGNHFAKVNDALRTVGAEEVDWLPAVGWNKAAGADGDDAESHADRMGDFIAKTRELHKFYLERLQEVAAEPEVILPPVLGVMASAACSFTDAVAALVPGTQGLEHFAKRAHQYGRQNAADGLTSDEAAAVYLYTTESAFYRRLNAALREPDRERAKPFFGYLRLLLSALPKLKGYAGSLWRGVATDLCGHYPKDRVVTWWGVSSCTAKRSVATSFIGSTGRRTLFEVIPVRAAGIRRFSAFTGEDEYLLLPGVQLRVTGVQAEKSGLCTITLAELPSEPLVG